MIEEKSKLFFLIIFISIIVFETIPVWAVEPVRPGIGLGTYLMQGDRNKSEADYQVRLFLRHDIASSFQGEFGISNGRLNDGTVRTDLNITVDYRFLVPLYHSESAFFFMYLGAGILNYSIKDFTPDSLNLVNPKDWAAYVPGGVGIDFMINDKLALGINGGYNLSLTDHFDGILSGDTDGFWGILATLSVGSKPKDTDSDQDGLPNKFENSIGTDPKNPDSDGDNLRDGAEVDYHFTDPLSRDTDSDALTDGEEVMVYYTNPSRPDTDGDQLTDYDEIKIYKTNPKSKDSDLDRLSDFSELKTYNSNPLVPDTDSDSLMDGEEVQYRTSLNNPDTDGDGLTDGDEVYKYQTNPLVRDTDGGTIDDYTETIRGTDPLDPTDDVVLEVKEVGAAIVLEDVNFKINSAEITPESSTILQKALNTLLAYPDMHVEIAGYTDDTGSRSYNMSLSQRRADSVRGWLIQRGIDPLRITVNGYGPDNPRVPNTNSENRSKNRRIEFVRTK